jgi:hypothetical protein
MTCYIPQNSDFQVVFSNITLDNNNLYFPSVSGWYFSIGSGLAPSEPLLRLNSFNHSGNFTIDSGNRNVGVSISASSFAASGGSYGKYYVALWAFSSGNYLGHLQQTINIQQQLKR